MNSTKKRGFEIVDSYYRKCDGDIILPTRGSQHAAGYDFYSNETVIIKPGQLHMFATDVKAYMQDDEVLQLYVRSSIGYKKHLMLCNGTGIIDSDFYENKDNDGNIGIGLFNYGEKQVVIERGERIAQGVFMTYLVADSGNSNAKRVGGYGSSGK